MEFLGTDFGNTDDVPSADGVDSLVEEPVGPRGSLLGLACRGSLNLKFLSLWLDLDSIARRQKMPLSENAYCMSQEKAFRSPGEKW